MEGDGGGVGEILNFAGLASRFRSGFVSFFFSAI